MYEEIRNTSVVPNPAVIAPNPFPTDFSLGGPLDTNVANPRWGKTPEDYVEWFNRLWHTGDPSGWGPEVFTPNAIMLDPAGTSTGAAPAANDFLLLFKYFPNLRGEVMSWSRNENEIFINWRFVVTKRRECPVIDKFSFQNGLVSYREAYFDTVMLLGYLAENFGSGNVVDYFMDRFVNELGGSGVLFAPSLIATFVKGLFFWSTVPLEPPTGLTAKPGRRSVSLSWNPVPETIFYRVSRSNVLGGSYSWVGHTKDTTWVDEKVNPGVPYFYKVCAQNTVPPEGPLPPDPTVEAPVRITI